MCKFQNIDISKYTIQFANLHTKVTDNIKQPHKAILLLSIMELVRCHFIKKNKIPLGDTIKTAFSSTWNTYYSSEPPNVWTPFWHMKKEDFWHFMPQTRHVDIDSIVQPGETASIGKMRSAIRYAYLDSDLFNLICDKDGREYLKSVLLETYIDRN